MPKRKYQTPEIMHDAPLTDNKPADFHFDDFAATFARLIASPKTETPLAIGINGAWGSGKTTLLQRVKKMLDYPKGEDGKGEHHFAEGEEKDFRNCKTVWFDAWKYNQENELLVALVRVILQAMNKDGLVNNFKAWLNDPTQNSYDVVAMFVNAFEASFGGLKFKLDMQKHEEISPFKEHTAFFDYFTDAFNLLLKAWTQNGILVIFIDDLDRCLPEKTVQTLEAIKLFLDKRGCVFMIGADTKIVQAAVETHYENAGITGESAKDYLEKIIQIRFDIPPIVEKAMEDYLKDRSKENNIKVDEAMLKRWQALVAAAEVNPRRVKNVINDLNLRWFMAVNSGQAKGVNRDDFICWQALMRAAPEKFMIQVMRFDDKTLRHRFVLDALRWQKGKQKDMDTVKGFFSDYEDEGSRRLRKVLKQISFSKGFTPDALDSIIYMTAPLQLKSETVMYAGGGVPSEEAFGMPTIVAKGPETAKTPVVERKGEVVVQFADASLKAGGNVKEPVLKRGKKRSISDDQDQIEIGGIRFMRVPAGKFVMGSKEDNQFTLDDERPQHTISIAYSYWMAKFVLTNQQFTEFAKTTSYRSTAEEQGSGYIFDGKLWKDVKGADWKHPFGPRSDIKNRNDHPVVLVSWDDAIAYCNWFNKAFKRELINLILRLPTEAEWEKAARGAYGNEWPWGNHFDPNKCNSIEGGKGSTTPVGSYSSLGGDSPYGCADMVGNVWEWTHSLYSRYPYRPKDGREDEVIRKRRVLRGGSFYFGQKNTRCAARDYSYPENRYDYLGFRVCCSQQQV